MNLEPADIDIDAFPAGCLTTASDGEILFANMYMRSSLGFDEKALVGRNISTLFSHVSQLLLDSLFFPTLRNNGTCEEMLLALIAVDGGRIPVVVNAQRQSPGGELVHWVMTRADKRQRLHQSLIDSRDLLEDRANRLSKLAATDELTGLFNRREFLKRTRSVFSEAGRTQSEIGLMMADVDDFKKVNDTYGHDVGDEVLRFLGQSFLNNFSSEDIVARYGGDEFIFCLQQVTPPATRAFAQKLRAAAEATRTQAGPVSLSVGISIQPGGDDVALLAALRDADTALYAAKQAGKDSIFVSRDGSISQFI